MFNFPSKQNINIFRADLTEFRRSFYFRSNYEVRYLITSATMVESFNLNFVFSSIIFKLTCLTVSWENYDAVKDRRNTSLRTLFIQLFVLLFSTFISLSQPQ